MLMSYLSGPGWGPMGGAGPSEGPGFAGVLREGGHGADGSAIDGGCGGIVPVYGAGGAGISGGLFSSKVKVSHHSPYLLAGAGCCSHPGRPAWDSLELNLLLVRDDCRSRPRCLNTVRIHP